eukprot:CAMPEP_0202708166 /NCGR_PEP_ID=MMETSP1385-20130828/20427_1 /ASSEMBLY_ACC=CAM_ASM_000861 /TAXON_ID=933848 /ORGANISM="Elphidium margaritaceum" /LENGTH=378 /DNA_ID=CAMNT_0049367077 /DNA_START=38 /DNA_END=1174 /DNA_ORIENTATION=-
MPRKKVYKVRKKSNTRSKKETKIELAFNEDITELLKLIQEEPLATSKHPLAVQELIVSYSYGFEHAFCWRSCHSNIELQNNGRIAAMKRRDGWSRRVHSNQTMKAGVHFIEFYIVERTDDISIGISNPFSTIDRFVGFDKQSYALACGGKLQHKNDADFTDPFSARWKMAPYHNDDIIGVELDLDRHKLSYFKNGKSLGTAFEIRNTGNDGYVFAVSMAVKGDSVRIVDGSYDSDDDNETDESDDDDVSHKKRKKCRKRKMEADDDSDDDMSEDDDSKPSKKRKLNEDKNENKNEEENEVEIPDEYCDPITYEIMKEPVLVTVSGVSYERQSIEECIKENGIDPMTRQSVTLEQIVPNRALRDSIARFLQKYPQFRNE